MVPEVEQDGDGIAVNIPNELGVTRFAFSQFGQQRGEFNAFVVASMPARPNTVPHYQRINLASTSARQGFVKALGAALGPSVSWEAVIARAFWKCRETFLGMDLGGWLDSNVTVEEPRMLVNPLLLDSVQNLVYGKGGTLKSYLALVMAYMVSTGQEVDGRVSEAIGPVIYLDYEADKHTFDQRWTRLCRFLGLGDWGHAGTYYMPGRGVPLSEQHQTIARRVEREGARLLVIDSVSRATAGLNSDETAVGAYFAASDSIPCAKLSIGHLNRADSRDQGVADQAAGVAAWRNAPRLTWWADLSLDGRHTGEYEVALRCTKSNERYPPDLAYRIVFGSGGSLSFRWTDAQPRAQQSTKLQDQITEALGTEPRNIDELRVYLGLPENKRETLRVMLYKGRKAGLYAQAGRGERWGVAAREDMAN
jgi:hypothetical protein